MTHANDPQREAALQRAKAVKLAVFDVDGVFSDGRLYYSDSGQETKVFHAQDGLGIKYLQRFGITVAVITGRSSAMVSQRMRDLRIDHVYMGREDKRDTFDHLLSALKLDPSEVAYIGDDLIDLPLLRRAGLAITVPNAHPMVAPLVHWTTPRGGGHGAVRDVCDLILEAQGRIPELLEQIG